jgi:hypothetical protein
VTKGRVEASRQRRPTRSGALPKKPGIQPFYGCFHLGPLKSDYFEGGEGAQMQNEKLKVGNRHLTPSQWLSKPATSQVPDIGESLRDMWSSIEAKRVPTKRRSASFRLVPPRSAWDRLGPDIFLKNLKNGCKKQNENCGSPNGDTYRLWVLFCSLFASLPSVKSPRRNRAEPTKLSQKQTKETKTSGGTCQRCLPVLRLARSGTTADERTGPPGRAVLPDGQSFRTGTVADGVRRGEWGSSGASPSRGGWKG